MVSTVEYFFFSTHMFFIFTLWFTNLHKRRKMEAFIYTHVFTQI